MDLEDIIASEISYIEKTKAIYFTYIWNIKKNKQTSKIEIGS